MNWAGKMALDLRRDLNGDGAQPHPPHLLDGKEDQRERAEKHDTALILLQDAKRRDEIDRNYRELVGGKRWRIVPALRETPSAPRPYHARRKHQREGADAGQPLSPEVPHRASVLIQTFPTGGKVLRRPIRQPLSRRDRRRAASGGQSINQRFQRWLSGKTQWTNSAAGPDPVCRSPYYVFACCTARTREAAAFVARR